MKNAQISSNANSSIQLIANEDIQITVLDKTMTVAKKGAVLVVIATNSDNYEVYDVNDPDLTFHVSAHQVKVK